MESSVDPKKIDPIINPIPRSNNPYLDLMRMEGNSNVLQDAAKSFLGK